MRWLRAGRAIRAGRASTAPGRLALIVATALVLSVVVSACDSAQRVSAPPKKKVGQSTNIADIYSSLPLTGPQGAEGRAIEKGIVAGLAEDEDADGEIEGFKVNLIHRNDAGKHGWTASAVEANAELAASDPRAVLYIGDLNSGATEISLPILNQAGIVQITPGSAYTGLTNALVSVTGDDEPKKYYPTGIWTLLRLIPDDMVQAAAVLDALSASPPSCQRVAAISVGPAPDAPALVGGIQVTAKSYKMSYLSAKLTSGSPKAELSYADDLKSQTVECLVITGRSSPEAVSLAKTFHTVLPTDQIIATSGLCNQKFTNPHDGGVPATLDPYVSCTSPVLPLRAYGKHEMRDFVSAYQLSFPHQQPGPYTAYGYVAGELASAAALSLGLGGDDRTAVQTTLAGAGEHLSTLMGTLYFDSHGNLLSRQIGLFHIFNGVPAFTKVLSPTKVVGIS